MILISLRPLDQSMVQFRARTKVHGTGKKRDKSAWGADKLRAAYFVVVLLRLTASDRRPVQAS